VIPAVAAARIRILADRRKRSERCSTRLVDIRADDRA
jgi:hypothetical protein